MRRRPHPDPLPPGVHSEPETLWNVHEAAAFLRKTPDGVYKMVERRQVPFLKIRQALRFDPPTLRAWALRHAVPANPEW